MLNRRNFLKKSIVAGGITLAATTSKAKPLPSTPDISQGNFIRLNNDVLMPVLGYGTLRIPESKCADCVARAIDAGWRLIDTAKNYANESLVGKGARLSGISRKELFLTSKIWIKDYGYQQTLRAFDASLNRLQTDYLDLCLLHQPFGDVFGSWRALEELYERGRIRAIGVSNFFPDRIVDLSYFCKVTPAVNQIEFHPYFQRWGDMGINAAYGVHVQSWGPLVWGSRPNLFKHPFILELSRKYSKTPAQVVLRSLTQQGVITVCKTERPERMKENLESLSFDMVPQELLSLRSLDTGKTLSKDHRSPQDVAWFHTHATRSLSKN